MFIGTGSFIIRGKRNFITPPRLELGFTMLFCLGEESLAAHMGERRPRELLDEINDDSTKIADDTKMEENDDVASMAGSEMNSSMMLEKQKSSAFVTVSVEGGNDEDINVV